MDIQSEINILQEQIDILKKKQEENAKNNIKFTMGHIWQYGTFINLRVKTFYIRTSHHEDAKYGFTYLDGSTRMFDSKELMFKELLAQFIYLGEDKNRDTNEK